MKGIILAAGKSTRLYPATMTVTKPLMPVYDKPMIYYPLEILMETSIRDILFITAPDEKEIFQKLLGDGSQYGCKFSYDVQYETRGIADAFLIGEKFIGEDSVALILCDNIFYGESFKEILKEVSDPDGGIVFAYYVDNPTRFGVVEFNEEGKAFSVEEKPRHPKSNYAIPGLYFFDNQCVEFAKKITPSERGELEIPDVYRQYLETGQLKVKQLTRGTAWIDTGTFEALNLAATFVNSIEKLQGIKIGCIEEVAYRMGFIDADQLKKLAKPLMKSGYGDYLMKIIKNGNGVV
jgi:glucose-1-phosphate thymidylyltransferase